MSQIAINSTAITSQNNADEIVAAFVAAQDNFTELYAGISAEIVTAANVITAAESGRTFFLNAAAEFPSTLPAPALGLNYTFVVSAAPVGASYTIVTNASANIIKGQVFTSDVNSATDADFEIVGGDNIVFVDAKSVAGDTVVIISDGVSWFARCFCSVFDAITINTAS